MCTPAEMFTNMLVYGLPYFGDFPHQAHARLLPSDDDNATLSCSEIPTQCDNPPNRGPLRNDTRRWPVECTAMRIMMRLSEAPSLSPQYEDRIHQETSHPKTTESM